MKIVIHRGDKEIGASCIEIESSEGSRIIIDVGLELAGEKAKLPKNVNTADAIFISHAHPDHFGLIDEVSEKIPAYCGEITEMFLKTIASFNYNIKKTHRKFLHFKHNEPVQINDIKITPFITDHSIPDAYAFLIEADKERFLYSGDFRETGRKPYSIKRIIKAARNIDTLIIEGTCIEGRDSSIKSEQELEDAFFEILNTTNELSFVHTSSINVDRLVSIYKATKRAKRIFVIDIYTALILWQMGEYGCKVPQMDWKHVKVLSRGEIAKRQRISLEINLEYLNAEDFRAKIYSRDISILPDEIAKSPSKYVIKNSQTEGLMKEMNLEKAHLIYSMWSGYMNPDFDTHGHYEKIKCNPNITFKQIHTSGHAMRESIFNFIDKISPKKLIPFHTNHPEKFAEKYPQLIIKRDEIKI